MKILDILKLSALHGQERLSRLEFAGKFCIDHFYENQFAFINESFLHYRQCV